MRPIKEVDGEFEWDLGPAHLTAPLQLVINHRF